MNERIKELAIQAGLSKNFNPVVYEQWYLDSLEKFAELIVRECARVAAATPFPDTDIEVRKTYGHTWDMACSASGHEVRSLLK